MTELFLQTVAVNALGNKIVCARKPRRDRENHTAEKQNREVKTVCKNILTAIVKTLPAFPDQYRFPSLLVGCFAV